MRRPLLVFLLATGLAACAGGKTAREDAAREVAAGFAAAARGAAEPAAKSARKPRIEYFQISEG
jgi:hypothetical protein